jgi:hypothetical protein
VPQLGAIFEAREILSRGGNVAVRARSRSGGVAFRALMY